MPKRSVESWGCLSWYNNNYISKASKLDLGLRHRVLKSRNILKSREICCGHQRGLGEIIERPNKGQQIHSGGRLKILGPLVCFAIII